MITNNAFFSNIAIVWKDIFNSKKYNRPTSIARCALTESLDIEPPKPLLPRSLRGPALSEHDGGESISNFVCFTYALKSL